MRINDVDRFTKQSPRMVLEEHSHCEVPAGCGGVVLRWINPTAGVPLEILAGGTAQIEVWVDGERVYHGTPVLAHGEHQLALRLRVRDPQPTFFFAATPVLKNDKPSFKQEHIGPPVLLSGPDGAWRCTDEEPPAADWTTAPFGNRPWHALEVRVPTAISEGLWDKEARALGALLLTKRTNNLVVFVRASFTVTGDGHAP